MKSLGFALIELIVIIIIISILVVVGIPAFENHVCKENPFKCKLENPSLYYKLHVVDSIIVKTNTTNDKKYTSLQNQINTLSNQLNELNKTKSPTIIATDKAYLKHIDGLEYSCVGLTCYEILK